jgi:large exoprotein involved in heme utilization and adhesion
VRSIVNNSVALSALNRPYSFVAWGLRVPNGKSLVLVGGDIQMNSGGLFAFGGRVELGGLAGAGTVGLKVDGQNLSLSFPNGVERSDISLSKGAVVDALGGDRGSIAVNARNLEMTGGSILYAGINRRLGSASSQAGNIDIDATNVINLNNKSLIINVVLPEAKGQGGDVNIRTSKLQVEGKSTVYAATASAGKGGSLTIDAQDVQIGTDSTLGTTSQRNSTGDAGNLTIKTYSLLVKDGARVSTGTLGTGKGGSLTVDAQDVQLIGTSADDRSLSGLFASSEQNSTGDAGNLRIETHSLLVKDGAQVFTGTFGAGKGGSLTVDAQDVQLIGKSADSEFVSGVFVSSQPNSTGDAGNLRIKTHSLLVKDRAEVGASTFGAGKGGSLTVDAQNVQLIGRGSGLFAASRPEAIGDAGNLTIKTHSLLVKDGAEVNASTFGVGTGGSLTVDAQDVQLIGTDSGLLAVSGRNSTGNAGNLTIKTHSLLIKDGAEVSASTFGAGKGGSLTVDAQDVQLIGRGSGLFASSQPNATKDAGNLTIKTHSLLLLDGAQILTATFSRGKGGSLTVDAQDVQLITGSVIGSSSQRNSTGDAGNLTIKTHSLLVKEGAAVITGTLSTGKGGSLTVDAQDVQLIGTGSTLVAASQRNSTGDAGNLAIKTHSLLVKDGAEVFTGTFGAGKGGSLTVDAQDVQLIGRGGLFASSQPNSTGDAGNLTIKTHSLLVKDGAEVFTGTFGVGKGGSLTVDASELLEVVSISPNDALSSTISTSTNGSGNAGNLIINTPNLKIQNGGYISTATTASGRGGDLTVNATDAVEIVANPADTDGADGLFASTNGSGNAGNLTLNTRRLTVRNGGLVSTATGEGSTGSGGNLFINARDAVELTGISKGNGLSSSLSVRSRGQGKAGNLTVNSPRISVNDRGAINAESFAVDGGNITLNTDLLLLQRGGTISATAGIDRGAGNGGNITINANNGFIIAVPEENSDIIANAFQGNGGNIQINSQGIFGLSSRSQQTEKSDITASSELGIAGTIALIAPDNSALQNSLSELSQNPIDTNALIANSCIVRTGSSEGTFTITGSGGLPYKPGDASISSYPTGDVQQVISNTSTSWKKGDPIVEPTGVYRLGNGKLVMSRECL